ncbi:MULTISPECIES: hypothetical protein [Rhodomicrobium]|uniref:hypothetical protein n=1 Tax=Rhodomicrobium TaxID=1068 RepID=UPI000B4B287C|nr:MULTISPECIES: hypothetical protein [Rhodomicrobium]
MTLNRIGFSNVPQPAGAKPAASVPAGRMAWILAIVGAAGLTQFGPPLKAHAFPATPMTDLEMSEALLRRIQFGAGFAVENSAGTVGMPLALKVRLPRNQAQAYSFLMFRNLPPEFKLSAGFGTKDYWAVSLNDIDGLMLIPPPEFQGMFTMDVLLIRGKDIEPERYSVDIAFTAINAPETTAALQPNPRLPNVIRPDRAVAPPPAETMPERIVARSEPQAQEMSPADKSIMERGNILAQQGDIASARLFYLQVARKGIAAGALAMGRSFDPQFLNNLKVRGLQPDIAQARSWYKQAQELGSDQASRYLAGLNAR